MLSPFLRDSIPFLPGQRATENNKTCALWRTPAPEQAGKQPHRVHQKRPLHPAAKGEIPRYHLYSLPGSPTAISTAFNGLHPGAAIFYFHCSGSKATFRPICSQTAFQPPDSSLCWYKGRTPLFLSLFCIVFNNSRKQGSCQGGEDINISQTLAKTSRGDIFLPVKTVKGMQEKRLL